MDILRKIMAERAADVAQAKRVISTEQLLKQARHRLHHSLAESLRSRRGTAVIAEVKKASPSAGLLRPQYDPAVTAVEYAAAGAVGISVLTEPLHFLGSEQHLRAVRAAVELPVLRKDFLCDPYQVIEAAAWGADVVLLIVAALPPRILRSLYEEAMTLGLEVLAEAHTAAELEQALELERAIIGINSRDLKTLKTDLGTAEELAARIPAERLSIAESGIKSRADIRRLEAAGFKGFLIGETLLRAPEPGLKLKEMLGDSR